MILECFCKLLMQKYLISLRLTISILLLLFCCLQVIHGFIRTCCIMCNNSTGWILLGFRVHSTVGSMASLWAVAKATGKLVQCLYAYWQRQDLATESCFVCFQNGGYDTSHSAFSGQGDSETWDWGARPAQPPPPALWPSDLQCLLFPMFLLVILVVLLLPLTLAQLVDDFLSLLAPCKTSSQTFKVLSTQKIHAPRWKRNCFLSIFHFICVAQGIWGCLPVC